MAIPKNRDGKTDLMFVVNKKKITHSDRYKQRYLAAPATIYTRLRLCDSCVFAEQFSAPSICKFININSIEKLD